MGDKNAGDRLRGLAEAAADFKVDSNIPIRRYFRSGNEMIKMAEVYFSENKLEAAYVLYMKYMTLHVEKMVKHRDYAQVLPAEKKQFRTKSKDVMAKAESLKSVLRERYEQEHALWLAEERLRAAEIHRLEEQEKRNREESARIRAAEEASIEKDRQVALWHQAQLDAEAGLPPSVHTAIDQPSPSVPPPYPGSDLPSAPSPNSPPSSSPLISPPSAPPSSSPPSYDRCIKPSPSSSVPATSLSPSSSSIPSFDRSTKPSSAIESKLRTVVVPGDLMENFLKVAEVNSTRGIETLGTLGGQLTNDRLVISHLVIPRQTGKGDSCTMEGLEDVWDVHDKEDIIFLGWIHTHPEYDVFLSSVDMHNQYEWQHMLPEALAIVCSIKFNDIGFLSLTPEGMAEIGRCNEVNFHPHSKNPPLFENATHVDVDQNKRVNLKDLR